MEQWQKYFENGEYLRSTEMTEEQNYNMIEGRLKNIPGKKQAKQKEVVIRSGKQPEQAISAETERN